MELEAGQKIDAILAKTEGWRGETLGRLRELMKQAVPDVVESIKWVKPSNPDGVPTWEHNGIICTGELYKDKVKLTFAKGAQVNDPAKIFNSSLEGNARRAIDFFEGDKLNEAGLVALFADAAAVNSVKKK